MTDVDKLKRLAEEVQQVIPHPWELPDDLDGYTAVISDDGSWKYVPVPNNAPEENRVDYDYIAACDPKTILSLIERIEELETQLLDCKGELFDCEEELQNCQEELEDD